MNNHCDEFTCTDCNSLVFSWNLQRSFAPLEVQRCAVCQWLFEHPDFTPAEVAEIRLLTGTPTDE